MRKNSKVCVIGLDGVNKQILDLIGLKTKEKNSTCTDIFSTIPPYTPPAWTSILSGVDPGKHGIYGFYNVNNGQISLANSLDVKYPRLFELLDLNKLKSVVINAPMTYPFEGIRSLKNTTIVTDWASPVQEIYPKALSEKYREFLVNPPCWNPVTGEGFKYSKDYSYHVVEYLTTRLDLYYDLMESYDWNLFFAVFSETDWLLHRIPELLEGRKVSKVQRIFNELRNFFRKACEISDVTMVVSDHGFEIKRQRVSINSALLKSGMLSLNYKLKKGSKKVHWLNRANEVPVKSTILGRLLKSGVKILPKRTLWTLVKKLSGKLPLSTEIDYFASDAFMFESPAWRVNVNKNVKGVWKTLEGLRGIREVIPANKLYGSANSSDLVLIPEKGVVFDGSYRKDIYEETYEADHEIHGVFLVVGDFINDSPEIDTLSVYDITPTILHVFGLPIPDNTDGRIITEMFEPDSELAKNKPIYVQLPYYVKKMEEGKLKDGIKKLKRGGKI